MPQTGGNNTYLADSPVAPPFLLISNITRANPCVVTVTTANSYVVGQLVTFLVPFTYGMFQIDGLTGEIQTVDITNLIFSVAIDTIQFDTFVTPPAFAEQPASLSSGGSRNLYNYNQVPFHAVDGTTGN